MKDHNVSDVAYCGLFCGDCVIKRGRLSSRATALAEVMKTPEFSRLAEALPGLHPEANRDLLEYGTCIRVLEALRALDCTASCRNGGGSKDCRIRQCCEKKTLDGCWECEGFERCETLAALEPIHQRGNVRNLIVIRDRGMEAFLEGEKEW